MTGQPAFRPCRSVLSMPGSNPRALAKGRALAADVLMMDLEDAVAPEHKDSARDGILAAIAEGGYGARTIMIRVNGIDTEWWEADLTAAAKSGAHAVLLPKVDTPDTVRAALAALAAGGADGCALWCMVETPLGVLNARDIAASVPAGGALVAGTADLVKALHARHTPDRLPLLTALSTVVLAARAYGLFAIDAPFFDLEDAGGFEAACRQGVELGFDGKVLLHPKQLEGANAAFAPSAAEVETAHRIIAAHKDALEAGAGVTLLDGKLVEALHVEEAERLIALSARIAELDAAAG